jgi:hypothetical protein
VALGKIIPSLKEESQRAVALKVAERLRDPHKYVRRAAIWALGEIIPSLKDESLKENVALKVAERLSDPHKWVRGAAAEVLGKIGYQLHIFLPPLLEKLYTDTDFFDNFSDILYQLYVARAYKLINQVVNYGQQIELQIKARGLFGNALFEGVKTASLLWIYQNISYYLEKDPSEYEDQREGAVALTLQEVVDKLKNNEELDEEDEDFLKDFIHYIVEEVIKNEIEADDKNYPSVGGKLHFIDAGDIKEAMRAGILAILGIDEGAGFFAGGKKEYLLPAVHSVKNLSYIITALETMGLIQEPISFQYTIRGRMMDEVKYTAWLMLGLLPEQIFNILGYGESDIGEHGLIVHGGGNLDVKEGEEVPEGAEYDRTDFLFLWISDNFEEIAVAGQYFSYLLQNDNSKYQEFIAKLREIYSGFTITRQAFKEYIENRYQDENKEELLRRIGEIPWQDGKVNLDWIFDARWFNDTSRPSDYGPRYEASWEGMVLQVVLHEAFKYYYEAEHGEGSFAEFLKQEILDLYLPDE